MCGIFGYIMRKPIDEINTERFYNFISDLARSSEERGKDACGFSAWYDKDNIISDKLPVRAEIFVETSDVWNGMRKKLPRTLIGHTRATTAGAAGINNNNHPFYGERFDLVHNGSINEWKEKVKKQQLFLRSNTDSELYLRYIEAGFKLEDTTYNGDMITDVMNGMIKEVGGKFAILMLDKTNGSILAVRNVNPTYETTTHAFGGEVTIFASTSEIMMRAIRVSKPVVGSFSYNAVKELGAHRTYIFSHSVLVKDEKDREHTTIYFDVAHSYGYGYNGSSYNTNYGNVGSSNVANRIRRFSQYAFSSETFKITEEDKKIADEIDGMTIFEYDVLESVIGNICKELGNDDSTVVIVVKRKKTLLDKETLQESTSPLSADRTGLRW